MENINKKIASSIVIPGIDIQLIIPFVIRQRKEKILDMGYAKADYTFVLISSYILNMQPKNTISIYDNPPNILNDKNVLEIEKKFLESQQPQEIVEEITNKLIEKKYNVIQIWQHICEGWSRYVFN